MPEPRSARRPDRPRAPEPEPAAEKLTGPLWARAVHRFYDPIFDIRSRAAFQAALNDYVTLPPDERAFHDTHLLYRMVQGLESVHGLLRRIEARLEDVVAPDLSALEHLEPIREALAEIASSQPRFIQAEGWEGEEPGDEQEEEARDELGDDPEEDLPEDEDPDFIYDTIPDDADQPPRQGRRRAPETAPRAEPSRAEPPRAEASRSEPPRAEPPRPSQRPVDPDREALVGDLVPASEGPHGASAGGR